MPARTLVMDVDTGRVSVVAEGLPLASGHNGSQVRVSVGDRVVAWSTSPVDGDPARSQGLLHQRRQTVHALPEVDRPGCEQDPHPGLFSSVTWAGRRRAGDRG